MGDSPTEDSHRSPSSDPEMALVAHNNPTALLAGSAGINKRYRPAPAKTFQCRGYGECRMVFSRSEHLARHIRKHTGERPFTCHCGKQFSRLDNLRQHAQTVHADKLDQNEQMMRDLTSLHATMAAATKTTSSGGAHRGSKRQADGSSGSASSPNGSGSALENDMVEHVKQEDMGGSDSFRGRPGTSTGYEGDHNGIIYQGGTNWHVPTSDHTHRSALHRANHSFRDSSQSFRGPLVPSTSAQSQSFLGFSHTFNFVPELGTPPASAAAPPHDDGRPRSISHSGSRPPTADASSRTLPPLAAVVSAALPAPPSAASSSSSSGGPPFPHVLPLPGAFRRPGTATRPGTAPASSATSYASYFAAKSPFAGAGLGPRAVDILPPIPGYGGGGLGGGGYDGGLGEPASDSPFSFHPPSLAEPPSAAAASLASPPSGNPRKRPFPGGDDDGPRPPSSSWRREPGGGAECYEYGTESRPQSRRLSVMELCNDTDADAGARAVLSANASRPTTSSGLLSALALVDVERGAASYDASRAAAAPGGGLRAGAAHAAGGAVEAPGGPAAFGGGGVFAESRREFPSPLSPHAEHAPAAAAYSWASESSPTASPVSPVSSLSSVSPISPLIAPPAAVFSAFRGAGGAAAAARTPPSVSDASAPPSAGGSPSAAAVAAAVAFAHAHHRAGHRVSSPPGAALPRRGAAGGESHHEQVRAAGGAPHSPVALGMRV